MQNPAPHAAHRPENEAAARAEQERLRPLIRADGIRATDAQTIAGLDVAYAKDDDLVAGAVVVLDAHTRQVLDSATATRPVEFPYTPGLLAVREIPALRDALAALHIRPDVLVCDGYGLAHPRRFGLACHLGVLTDLPTFGFVSTGHRVDVETATQLTLALAADYRLPETTRQADQLSRRALAAALSQTR